MIKKFLACNTVRERLDLLSNTVRDNWTDQDRGIILNVFNMNAEDYASKEDKITAIEKYGCLQRYVAKSMIDSMMTRFWQGSWEREGQMTKEEIKNLFMQGIDCSQVVAGRFADELEMQESLLRKMSACFGGGMQCGETCGAVTGALMVIGLKYGHSVNNDLKQKEIMCEKTSEFKRLFAEKYVRG